jgi:hypothetical protein
LLLENSIQKERTNGEFAWVYCDRWERAQSVTPMPEARITASRLSRFLFEAVALAVAEFHQGEITTEPPGPTTEFCIMVLRKPIEHRIRLNRVTAWAEHMKGSSHRQSLTA